MANIVYLISIQIRLIENIQCLIVNKQNFKNLRWILFAYFWPAYPPD